MEARRDARQRQGREGGTAPDADRSLSTERERRPTIHDVAARAGVSKSLVSRVFADSPRVSERRRRAVLDAARELGYRPNAAARTLVRQRSHTVGILVSDLHNLFLPEVATNLDAVLEARGYTTFVVAGKHRRDTEEAALSRLLELRVDGIVSAATHLGGGALRDAARSTAVVNLTRSPRVPHVDSVVGDDRRGAALAVEHLHALGHRRIAMIADTEERAGADRIRGYRSAMAAAGCARECRVLPGGFTEAGGHRAAAELLDERLSRRPTAVFVASDLAALGVLDAAVERGVAVPGEISVVGYDNTPMAALRHIGLSSVDQSADEIGRRAAEALLDRIADPERRARRDVIAPTLVARATSGPARW